MRSRPLSLVTAFVLTTVLLSGCKFAVGETTAPTEDPAKIAEAAEGALERQTGVRPEIDCGDEPIPIKENNSVTCLLLDPVAGLEFDVVITFSEVEGSQYFFDIKVADVPNNAPQPTAQPGASVPVNEIEALAIRALAPVLDFVPEVRCEGSQIEIVVGNTVPCSYEGPGGPVDVVVTISEFNATTGEYSIRVTDA